jgi:hypothetical protein
MIYWKIVKAVQEKQAYMDKNAVNHSRQNSGVY